VVLPVENFAANGEHGLNCLCQPRGQPQYSSIVDLEKHLHRNGTQIIKILLHISYDEQLKRFLERIEEPDKNWKFSTSDIHERKYWKRYMKAYEVCFHATSTHHAPWYWSPPMIRRMHD
jgi:polyphosphate kinase 2 (PPK2 family)